MSAFAQPGFFPISDEVQALYLTIEVLAILGNAFFLFLLLRYIPRWPAGKTLLVAYHATTLIFVCSLFFPLVSVVATKTRYTPQQCKAPAVFTQVFGIFQILSLVMMAHVRWRIVACEVAGKSHKAPDAKRYMGATFAFAVFWVIVAQADGEVNDSPFMFLWHVLLCARLNAVWTVIFYVAFFGTAPYMLFCYLKILKSIRAMVDGSRDSNAAKEPVRLIYTLAVCYYVTHLPFYVVFFINKSSDIVTTTQAWQGWKLLQISFSMLAPIFSIVLTSKYRDITHALLTCRPVEEASTKRATNLTQDKSKTMSEDENSSSAVDTKQVSVSPVSA